MYHKRANTKTKLINTVIFVFYPFEHWVTTVVDSSIFHHSVVSTTVSNVENVLSFFAAVTSTLGEKTLLLFREL